MSKKYDENHDIIPGYSRLTYNDICGILETACDKICKYVDEYKDPDGLQKERCSTCPLADALWEYEDE